MRNKVDIFDTTLRDGAQTPGIGMNFSDRLHIAKALANVGVNIIEIGFAANSADFPFMQRIAEYVGSKRHSTNRTVPVICSLARVLPEDIELAYKSIEPADPDRRRIHIFIGTSEELMSYSHGKREDKILQMISQSVTYARELVGKEGQVQYSSEDALRTDLGFLVETIQTAINQGATIINVPDTTGFARPDHYYETILELRRRVKGIDSATLSAHIHNDSGNAVACTMKGIEAGVIQVEGCVLQLGERAGNVDWMIVVTNLIVLKDHYGVDVGHIDTSQFHKLAELVSSITKNKIPLNYPVVGKAAFSESSGIHVKGVVSDYQTYFVIPPKTVGREVDIVLGQTSGTNTTAYFLRKYGYGEVNKDYTLEQVAEMTSAVKEKCLAVRSSLTETEARLLAEHYIRGRSLKKRLELQGFQSTNSLDGQPSTEVKLNLDDEERSGRSLGKGAVDSFMNAVKNALNLYDVELHFWDERAVYRGRGAPGYELLDIMEFSDEERALLQINGEMSRGQEAIAESRIELLYKGEVFSGRKSARDITTATYEAIIEGFDALYRLRLM